MIKITMRMPWWGNLLQCTAIFVLQCVRISKKFQKRCNLRQYLILFQYLFSLCLPDFTAVDYARE